MIEVCRLTGTALDEALEDVARLRIAVFAEWPYLYDGDLAYEERYLQHFRASDRALIVGAYEGDWLIGAATGAPLAEHAEDFAAAFAHTDLDLGRIFYCAESVLLPRYRGRGLGHKFFDFREAYAQEHGFTQVAFCSVVRPDEHPARPANYRPLDAFWRGRGYTPLEGVVAEFGWKDKGDAAETSKPLQFWIKSLTP
ncbi:MAG: GNAT family N-acetyltransferase [Pseudomonadota bacterium]